MHSGREKLCVMRDLCFVAGNVKNSVFEGTLKCGLVILTNVSERSVY